MVFLRWFFQKVNYVFSKVTHTYKPELPHEQPNNPCQTKVETPDATPAAPLTLPEKQNDQGPFSQEFADGTNSSQSGTNKSTDNNHDTGNGPSQPSPELDPNKGGKDAGALNTGKGKRQWGPELYEFFFEHLMSVKNFDPNGLTEKLTLAWLTPTASKLRKSGGKCWGPYGLFINQYGSKEAFYFACVMEVGANLIALSLAILVLRPTWWILYLVLFLLGACLIILSMPQIDFWDVDCEIRIKPETWAVRLEKYKESCLTLNENKAWAVLNSTQVLDTDIVSYPYMERKEAPFMELESPEWPIVARKKKIGLVALWLSGLVAIDKESAARFFPHKNIKHKFSFKAFRDDVLLLNDAREHNGQCEYYVSFAFLAPRSIKARKLDGGFWGPLNSVRWPFISSGGLLREAILSAFLWLSSIGLGLLYCTYNLGLVYWVVSICLIALGLIGALGTKNGVEDWYDDDLWGGVPSAYPTKAANRASKYRIYRAKVKTPGLNSGFALYVLYFSNFF